MKKILTIILILLTTQSIAQSMYISEFHYISVAIDPKMLVVGAYDYDKTPILDITLEAKVQRGNNEVGIFGEFAKLKPEYFTFGVIYNRIFTVETFDKVDAMFGVTGFILHRDNLPQDRSVWLSGGLNNELRYKLSRDWCVSLVLDTKWRSDIKKVRSSGFVKVSYVIERLKL